MTEKRYYAHKHLLQKNKVHDKICHNFMDIDETVEHMNNQYWKYKQLKEENEQLKKQLSDDFNQSNCITVQKSIVSDLKKENEQLKASLYAEKTNTAEVVNDYSKQFKRHSAQFSFMMDLADDLGVDVTTLEALDD